ncbi:MAG: succinate dehydrogenase/fumarate reductase iron-sulfur subunit [Spirochaetia bacterium]
MRQLVGKETTTIELVVKRWDPEEEKFTRSTFQVQADRFSTVLDMLLSVKERQDNTLAMRYSCNMGICGSCGLVINGKPRLACETNVFSLGTTEIHIGPMEAHPLVKDLVTDFDEFFAKHRSVSPWLVRKDEEEKFRAEKEYDQTTSQLDYYLDFAHCISCGLCVDACPVNNTNTEFVGPQALAQAYRYSSDSRDEGEKLRLDKLDSMDGVWGCEYAGACSEVCPKGVDPALTIQLTKLALMRLRLTGKTNRDKRAK